MADTKTALKNFVTQGRPLVEQAIDLADQFKALRDAARVENIDWQQLKTLLKAQIMDERDNGERLKVLIGKADNIAAYADMLGLGIPENNFSRAGDSLTIPPFLRRTGAPDPVAQPP